MRGTKTEVRRGVWRLRVVADYDPKTGVARQRSRTVYGTKKMADDALAAFVTEVRTGTTVASTDTLNALLDRWLDHVQADLQPTTVRGYRDKLARVRRDLGDITLDELTAQRLDRAYAQWRKEGLSAQTIRHMHRVLSTALHQAEKWDLVERAATDKATPPKHVDMPVRAPSPEVVLGLIEEARARDLPLLAAAIFVSATTGLRRGELCGLRWSDIDFDRRTLTVARSVKHDDGPGWIVGDTKTHKVRRIAIDTATIEVLAEHRVVMESAAHAAGVTIKKDGYVFTLDPTGTAPWRPDSYTQAFNRICWQTCPDCRGKRRGAACDTCGGKRLTKRFDVSLQELRHFTVTQALAAGIDIVTTSGRVGHGADVGLRKYAAFVPVRDQEAAEVLGALVRR
ncbi:MAG TPA: tyrosine-type recombinase/integrase [Acidimicrobiales bacterium]|nr:tyrosine-type recombinase/integrase [Acidimicrobiales bacterium]